MGTKQRQEQADPLACRLEPIPIRKKTRCILHASTAAKIEAQSLRMIDSKLRRKPNERRKASNLQKQTP